MTFAHGRITDYLHQGAAAAVAEYRSSGPLFCPFDADQVWPKLPKKVQQTIIDKQLRFFVIDGVKLGNELGLGPRINVIMQTAFFKISSIIPLEQAVREIKGAIVKSYSKAGEKVVNMNNKAVDAALENIQEVAVPATADSSIEMTIGQWAGTPATVQNTLGPISNAKAG